MAALTGKKVALLVSNYGVEEPELTSPRQAVVDAGGRAVVVAPEAGTVQTLVGDKEPAGSYPVDATLDSVSVDDFDALVLPGGTINADTVRTIPAAVRLVKDFVAAKKPIAAICHGPWALVEAGVLPGKTLTSYRSIATDVKNAGGEWVDQDVKVCGGNGWKLITSRTPDDLPVFDKTLVEEF